MSSINAQANNFDKIKKPEWWPIFTQPSVYYKWENEYDEPEAQEAIFGKCLIKAMVNNKGLSEEALIEEAFKLIEDEWYEITKAAFDFEGTDFAEYGGHIYFINDLDDNGVPFDEDAYDVNYEPEIRHFEDKLFAAGLISKKLGKSA